MSFHSAGWRGKCYGRTDDFDRDVPENNIVSGFRESCEPEPSKSLNHWHFSMRHNQNISENSIQFILQSIKS